MVGPSTEDVLGLFGIGATFVLSQIGHIPFNALAPQPVLDRLG
jgi:hypothetical protein